MTGARGIGNVKSEASQVRKGWLRHTRVIHMWIIRFVRKL